MASPSSARLYDPSRLRGHAQQQLSRPAAERIPFMTRASADSNRLHSLWLVVGTLVLAGAIAPIDISASAPTTFRPPVPYSTGGLDTIFPDTGGPVWVLAADVNGDNQPDLLVANWCRSASPCASSSMGVLI